MNRIAMVTGATSGIGRATALRLAESGFRMIITARRADELAAVAEEIRAIGGDVHTIVFDVRDREACREAVATLPEEWKGV